MTITQGTWAWVVEGAIVRSGSRPNWLTDAGELLTDEEFVDHDWFPVVEAGPIPAGKKSDGQCVAFVNGSPQWVHSLVDMTFADYQAEKLTAVYALVETKLAIGAPIEFAGETLHVAVGDGSRADLGSMATNAIATMVTGGQVSWLESYIQGWITIENVRVPLAAPIDGLQFASTVAAFYGPIVQNGRTLKDAIIAASDRAALDAIDINAGWPA